MLTIIVQTRVTNVRGIFRSHLLVAVLVAVGALLASPGVQAQTTWYVDDDAPGDPGPGDPTVSDPLEDGSPEHPFDAIQEGIDATTAGDIVEIADGTYAGAGNRDLHYHCEAITVRSAAGDPASCIIDCQGEDRGFSFSCGEGPDAILEGLTITNGFAYDDGGGVYFGELSSPTLINCIISGNSADDYGGGVYCANNCDPTFIDCTISGNSAQHGGGVGCPDSGSFATFIGCTISENSAEVCGGGVFCSSYSFPMLIDCTISGNSAEYGGGIDCVYEGNPTLANCTIKWNSARVGGGIRCNESNPTLIGCAISGNLAAGGGGIVCGDESSPTLTNCTISGNSATRGGGVLCRHSTATLANCTIGGNSADEIGGGVYCRLDSTPSLANCILWGDTPEEIYVDSSSPVVTYCNVQGGWTGTGNIGADPQFVRDPNDGGDGWGDDPNTPEDESANDDYGDLHLQPGSPGIDAGDNTAVPADVADLDDDGYTEERTPFDLDGNPRFVQDPFSEDTGVPDPPRYRYVVDMGAYEYQFCFGDLDEDDDIDTADLIQLLGSYGETAGMTYYDGDLDGDGDVDLADLAELLGHYGESCW